MFSETYKVRFSECDSNGYAAFTALMNYMQDTAAEHQTSCGYGYFRLRELGCFWVLLSWDIEVLRYPKVEEKITATTYVNRKSAHLFVRSFDIKDGEGKVLARASSNWVTCSAETNKAIGAPSFLMESCPLDEYEALPRFFPFPREEEQDFSLCRSFSVKKRHLDLNGHVNNVRYTRFALDELDPKKQIRKARIYFCAAAHEGEGLQTFSADGADGTTVIKTASESGETKTLMRFWLTE